MCCPVGITWKCGCHYRAWWICVKSRHAPCGTRDLVLQGPPPPPPSTLVPPETLTPLLRGYQSVHQALQTHLTLTYCCSPECCTQALANAKHPGAGRSKKNAVAPHLHKCWSQFSLQLGKLNNMRLPGEPEKTGHPPEESVVTTKLGLAEEDLDLTHLRNYRRLYSEGQGLQQCQNTPWAQFVTVRCRALANAPAIIHSLQQPPTDLTYKVMVAGNVYDNNPTLWRSEGSNIAFSKIEYAGTTGLFDDDLVEMRIVRNVINAQPKQTSANSAYQQAGSSAPAPAQNTIVAATDIHHPQSIGLEALSQPSWILKSPTNFVFPNSPQTAHLLPMDNLLQANSLAGEQSLQQTAFAQEYFDPLPPGDPGILRSRTTPPRDRERRLATDNSAFEPPPQTPRPQAARSASHGASVTEHRNTMASHPADKSAGGTSTSSANPPSSNTDIMSGKKPVRK